MPGTGRYRRYCAIPPSAGGNRLSEEQLGRGILTDRRSLDALQVDAGDIVVLADGNVRFTVIYLNLPIGRQTAGTRNGGIEHHDGQRGGKNVQNQKKGSNAEQESLQITSL